MQIFNLSLLEIVFIVLLAFIVLGPQKAVEEAGNLGRWIRKIIKSPFWRDLVSTSKDIKDIPKKIMDDAEIQKTLEDIDRSVSVNVSSSANMENREKRAQSEHIDDDHRILPN
jgi:sec-independent protein translocase protein TatB